MIINKREFELFELTEKNWGKLTRLEKIGYIRDMHNLILWGNHGDFSKVQKKKIKNYFETIGLEFRVTKGEVVFPSNRHIMESFVTFRLPLFESSELKHTAYHSWYGYNLNLADVDIDYVASHFFRGDIWKKIYYKVNLRDFVNQISENIFKLSSDFRTPWGRLSEGQVIYKLKDDYYKAFAFDREQVIKCFGSEEESFEEICAKINNYTEEHKNKFYFLEGRWFEEDCNENNKSNDSNFRIRNSKI